ncbi:unnamed protein product [Rhizoctonia solani]|uniref:Major facilitator superfamily (MFS) profile domain-containing protein n=1 Tax=Rhizoctonia solani TaxID=456999 RepID=A0A8H3AKT6_9AGAM|nr:unnamed protein product [Rhizoctonia solani]
MDTTRRAGTDEENVPLLPIKTKFSWSTVGALLAYISIINAAWDILFPFTNHLILSTGIAPDEKSVGFYSGLMQTIASFCDFASTMPGSFAADRWGRKVVLCSALIGTSVGLTFFGVSKTLPSLIISRCIGSAIGPQLGWATTVIVLSDIVDPGNRGIVFSAMNAACRFGQFFNPKSDGGQSFSAKNLTSNITPPPVDDHILAEQPRKGILTPHIIQLLISSWVMYFLTMGFISLFYLWAFTPISSGGLGASEVTIGWFLSARSITKVVVLIPFAYFESRLGVYRLYAYSLTIFTVSGAIAFPLLNMLAKRGGITSLQFNLAMIFYFVLAGTGNYCMTCMVIMINQATPTPRDLARLVGISQSVLMLGQCIAPVIVSSIFELSIKSDLLGGNIIWVFLISVSLIASAQSFMLRAPSVTNS